MNEKWSYLILRIGLGITLLWIGIDMWRHPTNWIGYIPATLPAHISQAGALQGTMVLDTALGILFLLGLFPRLAAAVSAFHLAGILILNGIDAVLIRDVGLLGASLALFVWPHSRRKRWWKK